MSRSSLEIIRVRRIWILTLLQGLNFALWMLQAKYMMMNIWLQVRWAVCPWRRLGCRRRCYGWLSLCRFVVAPW